MRELSLHILDILENSLESGASRIELEIDEDSALNQLTVAIRDNGRGMSEEMLQRISDPFFTTRKTRSVGLGIPLFRAAAQRCNGALWITSKPGEGTRVLVEFERDHIDRAPIGDLKATLLGVALSDRQCTLSYRHRVDSRIFGFDTAEIVRELEGIPLGHPRVRSWFEDYLSEGFAELYGNFLSTEQSTETRGESPSFEERRDAEAKVSGRS